MIRGGLSGNYIPLPPGGFTEGRVPFGNATGSLTQDTAFNWDNTNKRLKLGTTSALGYEFEVGKETAGPMGMALVNPSTDSAASVQYIFSQGGVSRVQQIFQRSTLRYDINTSTNVGIRLRINSNTAIEIDGSRNIYLPDFTADSILFIDSAGKLAEDNANFAYDSTNTALLVTQGLNVGEVGAQYSWAFRYRPDLIGANAGIVFDAINGGYSFWNIVADGAGVTIHAASPTIYFGTAFDTNLYRSASNVLKTDGEFASVGTIYTQTEVSSPNYLINSVMDLTASNSGGVYRVTISPDGTNVSGWLWIYGNGTGWGGIRTYNAAQDGYLQFDSAGTKARIDAQGTADELQFNQGAAADVSFFDNATVGEVRQVTIDWYRTGDTAQRTIIFKGSIAEDDTFTTTVSNWNISGNVGIGISSGATGSLHVKHDGAKTYLATFEDSSGNDQFTFSPTGGVVFNEQGNDVDFRVEADTNLNGMYFDGTGDGAFILGGTSGAGGTAGHVYITNGQINLFADATVGITPYLRFYGYPTGGSLAYFAMLMSINNGNQTMQFGGPGSVGYTASITKWQIGPGAGVTAQKGDLQVSSVNAGDGALVISSDRGDSTNFNWFFNAIHNGGTNYLTLTNEGTSVEFLRFDRATNATTICATTSQLLGFYGKTPVNQPDAVADATGAGDVVAQLNSLLARVREIGLIAT